MSRGGDRYGAGRPAKYGKADGRIRLEVGALVKAGALHPVELPWAWTNRETGEMVASITVEGGAHCIRLAFCKDGHDTHQVIGIDRTGCNYGGARAWFVCPSCSRRCAALYLKGAGFYCRTCCRLRYRSQSINDCARSWRRQQRLERRLNPDGSRPKGMHRATYARIVDAIQDCEWQRLERLDAYLATLGYPFPGRPLALDASPLVEEAQQGKDAQTD